LPEEEIAALGSRPVRLAKQMLDNGWPGTPRAWVAVEKLTCKETIRLVCEYLEGKLAPSVVRDLRWHLDHCKDCRMVLDAAHRVLEAEFDREPRAVAHRKREVA
jgi:hypothetical protein